MRSSTPSNVNVLRLPWPKEITDNRIKITVVWNFIIQENKDKFTDN
jgi:hypothetical protein